MMFDFFFRFLGRQLPVFERAHASGHVGSPATAAVAAELATFSVGFSVGVCVGLSCLTCGTVGTRPGLQTMSAVDVSASIALSLCGKNVCKEA